MHSLDELYGMLEARREELGLSQAAVGELAFGKPNGSALQNIKKGSWPSVDRLAAIGEVLGLELYFGPPKTVDERNAAAPAFHTDEFAPVPRLDTVLAAGPGMEPSEIETGQLAFRRDWMKRIGVSPARARIVAIRGDSMAPTLNDGDLALVDAGRTRLRPRRVYAFTDIDGQLRVKRLEPLDHAKELLLHSDNPAMPTEIRRGEDADRIVIHGQVMWSAHTWTE